MSSSDGWLFQTLLWRVKFTHILEVKCPWMVWCRYLAQRSSSYEFLVLIVVILSYLQPLVSLLHFNMCDDSSVTIGPVLQFGSVVWLREYLMQLLHYMLWIVSYRIQMFSHSTNCWWSQIGATLLTLSLWTLWSCQQFLIITYICGENVLNIAGWDPVLMWVYFRSTCDFA